MYEQFLYDNNVKYVDNNIIFDIIDIYNKKSITDKSKLSEKVGRKASGPDVWVAQLPK